MVKIPNIVPITDLRQDASAIVLRVIKMREPVVITQRGRAAAVMVSVEDYEHSRNELALMRLLVRGQKEIETGDGYALDAVLAEADILLEDLRGKRMKDEG
jgi:prevent-host-death family protein